MRRSFQNTFGKVLIRLFSIFFEEYIGCCIQINREILTANVSLNILSGIFFHSFTNIDMLLKTSQKLFED